MILLVAGASETAPLADTLLQAGHRVLVSLATETDLELAPDPALKVRRGRLNRDGFRDLIAHHGVTAVVDASHPFAQELHRELSAVCSDLQIHRIRYERPCSHLDPGVETRENHEFAADYATSLGKPVLLTTGSRNLSPYVDAAGLVNVPLFARVLPGSESETACRLAGLPEDRIEFARGPFSVEQTRELLRRWSIGVMVAKNGGIASGLDQRLEAARLEGVAAVVVRRPELEELAVHSFPEIMEKIGGTVACP
jgi:precorrin-6A/cobalt-precorrin-6A reductase